MEVPQIIFSSVKTKSLKIGSSEYFSANDFSLTENELEKARKELFETEEKKITKLQVLRIRLSNDNDFHYRTDNQYLLSFLRFRKYDCDRAYRNIREAFIFKRKHPEMSQLPENLENLLNLNLFMYFPYTDENGNIVFYFDLDKWKCEETSLEEATQVILAVIDVITMNPRIQVNEVIGIWDMKMFNLKQMTSFLRKHSITEFASAMQNIFPWRVKYLLVINTGSITRLFYKMVRPFLSKKNSKKIVLLGSDMKELHLYVNPVLLPKTLGGFLDENQYNVTENIMNNISYLKYAKSFTSNTNPSRKN